MKSLIVRKADLWTDGRREVVDEETGKVVAWVSPFDSRNMAEVIFAKDGELLRSILWHDASLEFILRKDVAVAFGAANGGQCVNVTRQ